MTPLKSVNATIVLPRKKNLRIRALSCIFSANNTLPFLCTTKSIAFPRNEETAKHLRAFVDITCPS